MTTDKRTLFVHWHFLDLHLQPKHKQSIKFIPDENPITIENRIYREEITRKKCKTAILLYCFHTAGVLHIFMLYNLFGPGISFYRKSKITVKRKPNYGIGWFHN